MFNNENNCDSPDASIGIGIQTDNIAAGGQTNGCCASNGKDQDVIVTAKIYVEYTDPYGNITPYSSSTCVVPPFSAQSGGYCVSGDGDSQKYQFRIPKNIQLSAEKNFNAVVVKFKPASTAVPTNMISYITPAVGKCRDFGGQVITTRDACRLARDALGVGGDHIGSWGHVPPGCNMWGNNMHFNTNLGSTRNCDFSSSKYCMCRKTIQSSTNERRFGLHIGLFKNRLISDGMGTGDLRSSENSNKNDVVSVQI